MIDQIRIRRVENGYLLNAYDGPISIEYVALTEEDAHQLIEKLMSLEHIAPATNWPTICTYLIAGGSWYSSSTCCGKPATTRSPGGANRCAEHQRLA
jgi:hypothetical protein